MKQSLLRDLHIDSTTSGSVADSDVTLAIIESIRYNRRYNLGFNQSLCKIYTESGVQKHDLPEDFLGICGDVLYASNSTDGITGKRRIEFRPLDWIDANMYKDSEGADYLNLGLPWCYGIDPKGPKIAFSPIPSNTGEIIEFPYIRDCGTPLFKYTGSAWAFYKPNSLDTLPSDYTNEYFNEAYHLVMNRAAFILWQRPYGGTEEASLRGQSALQLWADELNRMRAEANRIVGGQQVRPRI